MPGNPLQTLMAMLGGGFEGYGRDQQQRVENARQNRLVGLEFDRLKQGQDEFRQTHSLNRDRFGLDQELGRGNLDLGRARQGLDEREFGHREQFDWSNFWQKAQEAERDRQNNLDVAGVRAQSSAAAINTARKDEEAERLGAAYLSQLQAQNDPKNMQIWTSIARYQQQNPEHTMARAAYEVSKAIQHPLQDDRQPRPRSYGSGGRSFGMNSGFPGAGSLGGNPNPLSTQQGVPSGRAAWDSAAQALVDQDVPLEEIIKRLGPRPQQ